MTTAASGPVADGVSADSATNAQPVLIPHRRSDRVSRVFMWYTRRLFRKKFNAVRFERASLERLIRFSSGDGPFIMLGNHPSWWDPLIAVLVSGYVIPERPMMAVMDAAELERFAIFKKLGVFGVDPDDPRALEPMTNYLRDRFAEDPRQIFWITPQGHFTDVRLPIKLRPGAAAVAASLDGVRVGSVALEYSFWNAPKPEAFVRFQAVEQPERTTTTGWLRTMTAAMRTNQETLTGLIAARDPAPFEPIVGGPPTNATPIYNMWLRLRGRSGELGESRSGKGGAT